MKGRIMLRVSKLLLCLLLLISFCGLAQAQGILLRGIGAVNDSMAGTAIATPLDAAGSIYANPASISALDCQIGFDLGVIMPHSTVTSDLNGTLKGTAISNAGQIPAPTMSMIYRDCPNSRLTYGLAIAGVGGAAALYPSSGGLTNPILDGKAKASNVQLFEIMPTVSYRMTNRLSLGFSPVIGLASLSVNPMQLGMPLGSGSAMDNYGTRYTWGGGFNVGAYYKMNCRWNTGFTFKSPVWTNAMEFTGTTAGGLPAEAKFAIDVPMCLGWGISYDGFRKTVIGLDVRYMDYANTKGFSDIVDPSSGRLVGLGWDSVTAVSLGVERTVNDRMKIRGGYCYNTNPIPSASQYANVASPLMMQHVLGLGGSIIMPKDIDLHIAWTHAFHNEVSGSMPSAMGMGTIHVTNTSYADTILAGVSKRF